MYNLNQLQTFVRVAELGSFNKVADEEYISPNAVMKQIMNLETELGGIRLFERSNKGSRLTTAGEMLYNDAKGILENCDDSKRRILKADYRTDNKIRLVMTYESYPKAFEKLWYEVHECLPELKIEVQPVVYDINTNRILWSHFNDFADIAIDHMESDMPKEYKGVMYGGVTIMEVPLTCTVSSIHRLARKEAVTLADLEGEEVVILTEGWGMKHREVYNHIKENYPAINIRSKTYFSSETYNDCANEGLVIVGFSDLTSAHPFIKTIPVDEDCRAKIGLTYIDPPTPLVKELADTIKKILKDKPDIMNI